MYAEGSSWKSWMKDFKFGTFVFIPSGDLRNTVDKLRAEYDPISAQTSMAHITLTQPFARAPSPSEIDRIRDLIFGFQEFGIRVGPAITSPNKRLLWLDISPKEILLKLRESLHETGLFRTDLPLTKGFIPHMTLSEAGREPEEVTIINENLNFRFQPWKDFVGSITWIVPDEDFVFKEYQSFKLKSFGK